MDELKLVGGDSGTVCSVRLKRLKACLPYLTILVLTLIFFKPWFVDGKVFLAADTLFELHPWKAYAPQDFKSHNPLVTDPVNASYAEQYNRQLKLGHLSLWNPYIIAGVPSVNSPSMGSPGRWYPLKLFFHRLMPTHMAFTWLLLVHILLMGCTMYLYLRNIGAGARGALFGATAYMFNGCAMVWLSFETVVPYSAFLPLFLLCMEQFLEKDCLAYAFVGGLVFGMVFLLGHINYSLHFCLVMFFYYPFLLLRVPREGNFPRAALAVTGCFIVMSLTAMLIGAVEILPIYELIANSSRVNRTFDFQSIFNTLGRVPFRFLATLIFPEYFATPPMRLNFAPVLPGQEYNNYNELCLYLGLPTLLGLLAAFSDPSRPHTRFFILLTLLVAGMMTGTFIFWPFFKFFPGFDRLNPTRLVFLFTSLAAVTSGLGFDRLENWSSRRKGAFFALSLLWMGSILLFASFSGEEGLIRWFNKELFEDQALQFFPFVVFFSEFRSTTSPVIFWQLHIAAGSLVLFSALLYLRNRIASQIAFGLLLALLAFDLLSFAWSYNTAVDPRLLYQRTPSIDWLQMQPGPFRVLQLEEQGGIANVNTLLPFGIEELGGYANAYPERANKLMSLIRYGDRVLDGIILDRWVRFPNPVSPLYNLLNVRYILAAPGKSMPSSPYRLVWHGDLDIYENPNALPRAFVVHRSVVRKGVDGILGYMASGQFDASNEVVLEDYPPAEFLLASPPQEHSGATIEHYTPDEVAITAHMTANGWLVLSDTYFPGWKAYVDGKESPLLPADCALRAVALGEGEHRVIFKYEPASVWWGKRLTSFGFLGLITLGGTVWLCRSNRG